MNFAIQQVIEAIANDVLAYAHLVLENDEVGINTKVNTNTLRDSQLSEDVDTVSDIQSSGIVIKTLFNNYVEYIEWDRPPGYGKMPPIDELRDWAESRGIPTDNSTLFLIARAIQRDGHEGRPILATLEKMIEEGFDSKYYKQLLDAVTEELTKYFK